MVKVVLCDICGKEVKGERVDSSNAAITGEFIQIEGHKVCLNNVNRIVLVPNQMRIDSFVNELKEQFEGEKVDTDALDKLLNLFGVKRIHESLN